LIVRRYGALNHLVTRFDPFADLIGQIQFLASAEYTRELLITAHGVSSQEARQRAPIVGPYVRAACAYVDQASSGPEEVAFLPAYYAALNLLKVYIVFSGLHAQLPNNRWHGAAYNGFERNSQTLKTETLALHRKGAIPLLYQVLTGTTLKLRRQATTIALGDVYPYISSVSAEWKAASGESPRLAEVRFDVLPAKARKRVFATVRNADGTVPTSLAGLKALKGFGKTADPGVFVARTSVSAGMSDDDAVKSKLRTFLLYDRTTPPWGSLIEAGNIIPVRSAGILFPEEIPIALALLHLSSVTRYKPDFLERLRESRYWPVITVARRQALYDLMVLCWSYTHRQSLRVTVE
jgi:hypothetical protein